MESYNLFYKVIQKQIFKILMVVQMKMD